MGFAMLEARMTSFVKVSERKNIFIFVEVSSCILKFKSGVRDA